MKYPLNRNDTYENHNGVKYQILDKYFSEVSGRRIRLLNLTHGIETSIKIDNLLKRLNSKYYNNYQKVSILYKIY